MGAEETLEERFGRFEAILEQERVDAAAHLDARISQALEEQRLIAAGVRVPLLPGSWVWTTCARRPR